MECHLLEKQERNLEELELKKRLKHPEEMESLEAVLKLRKPLFRAHGLKNYFIDEDGNLFNIKFNPVKKSIDKKTGYIKVIVKENGIDYNFSLHRLLANTFIRNPFNKPWVGHINDNKMDISLRNLDWRTPKENCNDRKKNGNNLNGSKHHKAILKEDDVIMIRELYFSGKSNQKELANKFGVKQANISRIVLRKNWKHI